MTDIVPDLLRPCNTVLELSEQFKPSWSIGWTFFHGQALCFHDASDRNLSEVIVARLYSDTMVFPGWYRCHLTYHVDSGPSALPFNDVLVVARQRAVGPVGIIGNTTSVGVRHRYITNVQYSIWFEQEADAVDFGLNWDSTR